MCMGQNKASAWKIFHQETGDYGKYSVAGDYGKRGLLAHVQLLHQNIDDFFMEHGI